MSNIVKTNICPFCQKANNCMVQKKRSCWCNKVTISAALIKLLPEKSKDTLCICLSCINSYNDNPTLFKSLHCQHNSKPVKVKIKSKSLHPRNLHINGYDFPLLVKGYPPLAKHVKANAYKNLSIDFADSQAVKTLNAALLTHHYHITAWDIPVGALCPPIPGRVDYIHYIAELLGINTPDTAIIPNNKTINMLDIGTGANGIYPLLASKIYGWHCVASDINTQSLDNVAVIIERNPSLKKQISLRIQHDKNHMFNGIINANEFFDVTVCNPPFHASKAEALKGSQRKLNNLAKNRGDNTNASSNANAKNNNDITLNFGGIADELWCKGGEQLFLKKLIKESKVFAKQCGWFTSLVSKIDNIKPAKKLLNKLGAVDIRVIEMLQGNKITRILAWTYNQSN